MAKVFRVYPVLLSTIADDPELEKLFIKDDPLERRPARFRARRP